MRPPTTQEFALDQLRRLIVAGEIAPGRPIRQDAIAQQLGVSRVPLREALKTLEAEGQVVYRPHRGYAVAELALADLEEVYRLRDLLEGEAARTACAQYSADELERLEDLRREVDESAEQDDLVGMIAANRRFHFALLEPCGMPRLLRMVRTLWDSTDAYRAVYYNEEDNRDRVRREHERIARAAADRDAEQLVSLLDQHRRHAVEALRATIGPDGAAPPGPAS